jgi:hypothetical protein
MLSILAKPQRGEIVRTTYDTGPYSIIEVDGPCTSPGTKGQSYLNGYRHDGTNVWNDDHLIFPFKSQNSYRPG